MIIYIGYISKSLIVGSKEMHILMFFLAAPGLCCCMQAFSSCGERGLLFVAVRELLIVVASLVA